MVGSLVFVPSVDCRFNRLDRKAVVIHVVSVFNVLYFNQLGGQAHDQATGDVGNCELKYDVIGQFKVS